MTLLKTLLLAILAVFAPIQGVIITVLVMVIADLVLGVLAAHKRGELITSAGISRTVTKLAIYEAAILLGHLCEVFLLGGSVPIVKVVAALIGAVTMKSIMENLDDINGSSLFSSLIKKLGSVNDDKK